MDFKKLNDDKFKIAIIGAGTGGLFSAISLVKKFGHKVDISIYEKHPHFDLEKGVELSVGPAFQMAMLEVGMDVKKLREWGCPFKHSERVINSKCEVISQIENEFQDRHCYLDSSSEEKKYLLYEYSVKRGIFMDFLHSELLCANGGKEIIHWNHHLQAIISEGWQKKLSFTNGEMSSGFDFIIGADGVHSQVRKLVFDQEPPRHVGANILYGVTPGSAEEFEKNRFNVLLGEKFTTVSGRYIEWDKSISTWWAIIYPDQIDGSIANTAFWEKRNDVRAIKQLANELAEKDNNPILKRLIHQTPEEYFKYSGKFLERNPLLLNEWGIGNIALVGDAIHAMMPWPGVGSGMAAEDVIVLLSLFEKHTIFESHEIFNQFMKNNSFSNLYSEYKNERIERVNYFYQWTHKMAPNGILSENDFDSNQTNFVKQCKNQYLLASSPLFNKLFNEQLSSQISRNEFFEETV